MLRTNAEGSAPYLLGERSGGFLEEFVCTFFKEGLRRGERSSTKGRIHVAAINNGASAPQHEHVESTQWVAQVVAKTRLHSPANDAGAGLSPNRSSALEENLQTIKRWERAILLARSKAEQVSDWIACTAGSGPVLVLHVLWFGVWVTVNAGVIRAFVHSIPSRSRS
jgi:hypothetical protein